MDKQQQEQTCLTQQSLLNNKNVEFLQTINNSVVTKIQFFWRFAARMLLLERN